MKKKLLIVTLLFFLIVSTNVYSQSTTNNYQTRIGLGITYTYYKESFIYIINEGILIPTIFIPIKVSPKFRIEPEIGFYRISDHYSDKYSNHKTTEKIFQIGVGLCPVVTKNSFDFYFGSRIGYLYISLSDEYISNAYLDKDKGSAKGFYISPVLGGEYYFSKHFSLGGEVQVKYSRYNLEEKENSDKSNSTFSKFLTYSTVIIRIYF